MHLRTTRLVTIVLLLVVTTSMVSIYSASSMAHPHFRWVLELDAEHSYPIESQHVEEHECDPSSQTTSFDYPPRYSGFDRSINRYVITMSANLRPANCPHLSFMESGLVGIPFSQTQVVNLFNAGSFEVAYPRPPFGQQVTFQQVAFSASTFASGTVGSASIGWQSDPPDIVGSDGQVDPSKYTAIVAVFGVAATTDPQAASMLDGQDAFGNPLPRRVAAHVLDYGTGESWTQILDQYPSQFFMRPHDYRIAWVRNPTFPGEQPNPNNFDIIFYLRSLEGPYGGIWKEVGHYRNGTSDISQLSLGSMLGGPQVGVDTRLFAPRHTVVTATQIIALLSNSDPGTIAAPASPPPPVPFSMTIGGIVSEPYVPNP